MMSILLGFVLNRMPSRNPRDDLIRAILRNRPPYAVRHMRVTCMVIDIVESRSRMLADVLTSLPHMSI